MKTAAKISAWLLAAAMPLLANPILSHKYTADPQPIIWDGRLYVVASNDDKSVNENDGYVIHDYTLVSTTDMVNWTDHGEVFNRSTMNWNFVYAPGVAVRDGKVYMYPCGAGGPVGVAVADRPEGPYRNGKTLVDRSGANGCTNCNVPWMFDPHVFVDSDGQAYLYYGGGGSTDNPPGGQNMRVIRLNDDMISRKDNAATTVNAPRSFEASNMHKRGNTYYFSYVNNWDGGDGHPNAAIMYMTGTNPMGPFTLRGPVLRNPTLNGRNINRNNNNHHAAIEYPAGSDKWYMFYHDRRVADANNAPSVNQRNISVDFLEYNTDGTMKEVIVTENGAPQIKNFNPYDTIRGTTMNRQSGIKTSNGGEGSSMILTSISNNDWIRLKGVDFGGGATGFTVRASSNNSSGGAIELRTGSNTGPLVGTVNIASTGSWSIWRDFDVEISGLTGVKDFLYLVFKGSGSELFRISSYKFSGAGSGAAANIGCNLNNLQPSYTGCSNVIRPNVTCSNGAAGTASFSVDGSAVPEWNNVGSLIPEETGGIKQFCVAGIRNVTLTSLVCGGTTVTPSSPVNCGSFIVRSEPVECSYQTSYCGGKAFADVQDASNAVPATGTCVYIGNFEKIQPNLEATVAINGVENTCGTEWGEEEGKCMYNTKPPAIDGGYYVYVKTGGINLYDGDNPPIPNGWTGVVAAVKPNCASFTTGIKDKIPSDKTLHLKFGSAKVVDIYNLKGKKVASYNVLGAEDKINVSLPSGVYIAKARGMQNVKFVVK